MALGVVVGGSAVVAAVGVAAPAALDWVAYRAVTASFNPWVQGVWDIAGQLNPWAAPALPATMYGAYVAFGAKANHLWHLIDESYDTLIHDPIWARRPDPRRDLNRKK